MPFLFEKLRSIFPKKTELPALTAHDIELATYRGMVEANEKLAATTKSLQRWLDGRTGATDQYELGDDPGTKKLLETPKDWAYIPIKSISDVMMSIPYQLKAGRVIAGKTEERIIDQHPVLDLLEKPNPIQTYPELCWETQSDLSTAGDAYWFVPLEGPGRTPSMIVKLGAGNVGKVIKLDKTNEIISYLYMWPNGKTDSLPAENVIHFHLPGGSPLREMARAFDANTYSVIYFKNFFQNNARPDYAITFPDGLDIDDKGKKALKDKILSHHQGVDKNFLPLILGEKAEIKPLVFSQADSKILAMSGISRDKMFAAYSFPAANAGLVEGLGKANAWQADANFRKMTIAPRCILYFGKINNDLITKYMAPSGNGRIYLGYDNPVPADQEEKRAQEKHDLETGKTTIDELLEINGKKPIGGEYGQMRFMMNSVKPIEMLNQPTMPMMSLDAGQKEMKVLSEQTDKELWITASQSKELLKPIQEELFKRHVQRLNKFEVPFRKKLKTALEAQEKRMLRNIRAHYPKALEDIAHIKHDDKEIQSKKRLKYIRVKASFPQADLINIRSEISTFAAIGDKYIRDIFLHMLDMVMAEIGGHYPPDPSTARIVNWLKTRVRKFSDEVVKTSVDDVMRYVRQGLVEGQSVGEVTESLTEFFEGKTGEPWADYRSRRIARTEMNSSANAGSLEGYRQSEVVAQKGWASAIDERTRDNADFSHVDANGERVKINSMFQRTGEPLEFPGDPGGSEGNIINCRCSIYPVIQQ